MYVTNRPLYSESNNSLVAILEEGTKVPNTVYRRDMYHFTHGGHSYICPFDALTRTESQTAGIPSLGSKSLDDTSEWFTKEIIFRDKYGVSSEELLKLLSEPVSELKLEDIQALDFSKLEDRMSALLAIKAGVPLLDYQKNS